MDFHLGERVLWVVQKETAIIINLLDYEGNDRGLIGILLDSTRHVFSVKADTCISYQELSDKEKV